MSTLNVNRIESSDGTSILIPSGYSISVDGTVMNKDTLPPSPSGHEGEFLYSDGTSLSWSVAGPKSMQQFSGSGTWIKPSGITKVLVMVQGGGGAGSGHAESGGAGGYSEKLIDVTSVSSVQVTVGNGSTSWTYYSGGAGDGGTTSFGSFCSASGGKGANTTHQHCGGLPGVGSGGDINIYGGGGTGHMSWACAKGGSSFFGGAGVSGHPQNQSNHIQNNDDKAGYGAGGTGGYTTYQNSNAGRGKGGVVIVYEYT